ncbi:MAG TPA: fatty acyl-AMP ligase [Nakamurella sp.]|nr:fatty acyl-AMP ligase [Nakamurella sp.]
MSAFTDALRSAAASDAGMVTGEPHDPIRTTWAQVHTAAITGAHRLADSGIGPGDAVAVLAAGPAEVAPVAQAVWLAGGSVTMLHQPTARTNLATYAEETAGVLALINARAIVLGDPFTEFAGMLEGTGIRAFTVADLFAGAAGATSDGATSDEIDVRIGEDLPALLQLTSGSTARPKAVQITHRNLWANVQAMCASAGIHPGEVMVSWLPLFHDMGMVGFLTLPMCQGVELIAVTPRDFLSAPLLWPTLISKYRGTITAAPNFAYALTARVLARADGLDLSSMRFALNGAEPIDVGAVRAFLAAGARFGLSDNAVVPAYGMAEATLAISFHPWGTPLKVDTVDALALEKQHRAVPVDGSASSEAGTTGTTGTTDSTDIAAAGGADVVAETRTFPVLGPPLNGIDVMVLGPDGEKCTDREVGVLHLRGESVTDLYLTVEGPVPTRDPDGWLDTGDLGYLVDGEVVVCGRVKDVIIMGGRNIYPTDIERIAEQVEGVRAGNAVAVRWKTPGGRESFALAVESRQAGDDAQAKRIATEVRTAVTSAIGVRPAAVTVLPVGSLPKTPSGKLKRSAAGSLIS